MAREVKPTNPPRPSIADAIAAARNFHQFGELAKAEAIYRSILASRPRHADCLYLLGLLSFQRGRHDDAVDLLTRAVTARPDWAEANVNLGNVLAAQGRLDEALARFQGVLALQPQSPEIHYNLGNVLVRQGRLAEARERFEQALVLKPDWPAAHLNLGNVLSALAQPAAAAACYERGLAHDPDDAKLHNGLAIVLHGQGETGPAIAHLERALALEPDYAVAHYNLGKAFQEQAKFDEAVARFERALALRPDYAEAHMNLGTALMELRRLGEARAHIERGLLLQPDAAQARSNLLLCLNYSADHDREAVFAAHAEWGKRHAPVRAALDLHFANAAEPDRRLRVGYVSRDFRLHSAFFFVAPLLNSHHRDDFEVFCYADVARPDAFTRLLMARADRWAFIGAENDDAVAARVRSDRIDILVDLAGHTAHNRLGVFARKPAPVQVSWLGYPNTTGLETIDYRITDAVADPRAGADHGYCEELVRLPRCFLCYEPLAESGAVATLPLRRNRAVTFGSFNHLSKLTPQVVALWARLLDAVPGARLLLKAPALGTPSARDGVCADFARAGIGRERLDLLPHTPDVIDHLDLYGRVDIALDPFPYNGTTTTCEALWMGIPVVTLAGERHAGRVGASLLTAVGLDRLIARDHDAYISTARDLAGDADGLAALRAGLRERMQASPLCDGDGLARALEAAFRAAWRRWCAAPAD